MEMADIDRLLADASELSGPTPAARLRSVRDDLARAAVFLSYARHVLSIDLGILRRAAAGSDDPGDLQSTVDDLPRVLAEHSIGGGWSLSSDSPVTLAAADMALAGHADDLLSAHAAMARVDFGSQEQVDEVISAVDDQLGLVGRRSEQVEHTLGVVQGLIIQQYKTGAARVDDWLD